MHPRLLGLALALIVVMWTSVFLGCESNPDGVSNDSLIRLGRHLFYERRLSLNENRSCGICHEQAKGFTDGFVRAVGTEGHIHPRNTLTVINSGTRDSLSWLDPKPQQLSEQLLIPLLGEDPIEMGAKPIIESVLNDLNRDPAYLGILTDMGDDITLTLPLIAQAIEAFIQTIESRDAPYDRWVLGRGDLSASAERGAQLFFATRIGCSECHGGIDFDEPTESRHGWFNTGLYDVGNGRYPMSREGLWELTGQTSDIGRYRVPTLRHLGLTAPYYHDGSGATLSDVLKNYNRGGRLTTSGPNEGDGKFNPYKDSRIQELGLTDRDLKDLEAFLLSLTDARDAQREEWSDPWPRAN